MSEKIDIDADVLIDTAVTKGGLSRDMGFEKKLFEQLCQVPGFESFLEIEMAKFMRDYFFMQPSLQREELKGKFLFAERLYKGIRAIDKK